MERRPSSGILVLFAILSLAVPIHSETHNHKHITSRALYTRAIPIPEECKEGESAFQCAEGQLCCPENYTCCFALDGSVDGCAPEDGECCLNEETGVAHACGENAQCCKDGCMAEGGDCCETGWCPEGLHCSTESDGHCSAGARLVGAMSNVLRFFLRV